MTDLAPLLPRIEPLVRMLGSDNDHEALGAVRALGRVLHGAGKSFHDLAAAIGAQPEEVGYGEAYWKRPPRRYAGTADFVAPRQGRKPPPRPAGPPLMENLDRTARLAWLNRMAECDKLTLEQRAVAGGLRAQIYSQPHKALKPAQAAAINAIFAQAWVQDVRPIADVMPSDSRMPLRWTGSNREAVKLVLAKAASYFGGKDNTFATSAVLRLHSSGSAFDNASYDDLERIDELLVKAYDLGARP